MKEQVAKLIKQKLKETPKYLGYDKGFGIDLNELASQIDALYRVDREILREKIALIIMDTWRQTSEPIGRYEAADQILDLLQPPEKEPCPEANADIKAGRLHVSHSAEEIIDYLNSPEDKPQTTCPRCNGVGTILVRKQSDVFSKAIICPNCKGTGKGKEV